MRFGLTVVFVLSSVAPAILAQSDRGTITGTIADSTGAVVANAQIQAKQLDTGALFPTTSTDTGNYTLVQLPYGPYEITVTVPGFKKFVRSGVTVQVAQTLRIDVALEVGEATESVNVSAEASLLKTESGDVSHNVGIGTLDDLPMLGTGSANAGSSGIRNPANVTMVIPGAYYVPNSQIKINGAPSNSYAFHVEGMDSTVTGFPYAGAQTQPSVDAIQEISVQTSNFAPEYGAVGGGFFNVTIRSGTNQLHGSVYDYFTNEVLNAGEPFSYVNTPVHPGENLRPRARRNDYGFTIGGPVRIPKVYNGKDKTFFFWNFEQFRETQYINFSDTVPTLPYRNGDFSGAILAGGSSQLTGPNGIKTDANGALLIANTIYDPTTARSVTLPSGQVQGNVASPFPNNTIPFSRMDPIALKVQSLIPLPTNNATFNNYLVTQPTFTPTTIPGLKIDQLIGSKMKISGYWSFTGITQQYSQFYGNYEGFPTPVTEARGSFIHSWQERTNYDYTITPTLLLHLAVGYQRDNFFDDAPVLDYNAQQSLGLVGATVNRNFPVFNGFCASAQVCGAAGGSYALGPPGQTHSYWQKPAANGSVTWVKDNHTFKGGMDVYWMAVPQTRYTYTNGNYTFNANETAQPYLVGTTLSGGALGFPYASFLLGEVDTYNVASLADFRQANKQLGIFIQDSWKVNRKLTIDYGLRWDYGTYYREEHGRAVNFSPTTPNPSAGGAPGGFIFEGTAPGHCSCDFAHNYPYALGPRIGLAYSMNDKTVLRAGWGIIYGQVGTNQTGVNTAGIVPTVTVGSPGLGQPVTTLSQGLPPTPAWPNVTPGVAPISPVGNQTLPAGVVFLDPNTGRPPRQNQWSIGIQRELTKGMALDVTYVGNVGVWWPAPSLEDINAVTTSILSAHNLSLNNSSNVSLLSQTLASVIGTPTASQYNLTVPYAGFSPSNTIAQSLRPYPQFANIPVLGNPVGKTWYNSLQTKLTKRLSHGLTINGTFSWQKSLQVGVDPNINATVPNGGGTPTAYANGIAEGPLYATKSISVYDQPFISTIWGSYTLPRISQLGKVGSYLLRDWTIGTLLSYSSGIPIPVPAATTSIASQLFQSSYMNRVSGVPLYLVPSLNCHCFDPSTTPVLNPAAWANPAAGQFSGGSPYYTDYRYSRHPGENINAGREWRIKERAVLSLRVEWANFLNRTYINNPTSTNPTTPVTKNGIGNLTGGFGFINTAFLATTQLAQPRNGNIVARFTF